MVWVRVRVMVMMMMMPHSLLRSLFVLKVEG